MEKFTVYDEVVIVDKEDLKRVLEKTWHIGCINGQKYCKRSYRVGNEVKTMYLHEFITGFKMCGFKNGNTLDCTKKNLYDKSQGYDVVI